MATSDSAVSTLSPARRQRRVVVGTVVGTSIEWYGDMAYIFAASIVFPPLFFGPLAEGAPALALIISFASIGISFIFRPLGSALFGYLGDRHGRKRMLVITLLMMGGATTLIGLLPTYAAIGVWAPILVILCRIVQGMSAGGEWGAAASMAVESAPKDKRGRFGAFPQIGVPIGVILGTLIISGLSLATGPAYLEWAWRVPFLLSFALLIVGTVIRRSMGESPAYDQLRKLHAQSTSPLKDVLRTHPKQIVQTALIFLGCSATGGVLVAFILSFILLPVAEGGLAMDQTQIFVVSTIVYVAWLFSTMYGGIVSDRIGRVRVFQIGYASIVVWTLPMFWLIGTANIWLYGVAVLGLMFGIGLTYGPMAAMYCEMFPVQMRYSGIALGNAIGALIGGAFSATIAQLLFSWTGTTISVGFYIMAVCAISFFAVTTVKEPKGADLGVGDMRSLA